MSNRENQAIRMRALYEDLARLDMSRQLSERLKQLLSEGYRGAALESNLSTLRRELERNSGIPFTKKAVGGEITRNMTRGPKGIGAYEQFVEGGDVSGPPPLRGPESQGIGSLSETARRMSNGGSASTNENKIEQVARELVPAIIQVESSGDPNAVSEDGAIGLMQVLPSTAVDPGFRIPTIFDLAEDMGIAFDEKTVQEARRLLFNEELNVAMGTEYLKGMLAQSENREQALLKYNAGPKNFAKAGGDINKLAEEAQEYVPKVAAAMQGRLIVNDDKVKPVSDFFQSPEGNLSMKIMATEDLQQPVRPKARPKGIAPFFQNDLSESLRPMSRPETEQPPLQEEIFQSILSPSLREKYSPEGIEQMLIGTTGESPRPTPFPQDLLSSLRR